MPATLGTSFGMEIAVKAHAWSSYIRVKVITTNPPLTNPETGVTFTQSGFFIHVVSGRVRPIVYSFDEAWEIAPGTWTMQIFHEDELLVSEEFNVVAP